MRLSSTCTKALNYMPCLKEQKIWAHFGLTVSGYNAEFIKNRLASDIEGVRSFSFEHSGGIYKTESVQNEKQILASIRKVRSIYKVRQISEIVEYIYLSLAECFFSSNRKNVPVPCEVIASSLHIRPNGDISPCMYLPKIGSIKSGNLTGLLGATGTRLLRERARNAECSKCWMNCYAVHSIMRHPLISVFESVKVWIGISPNLHK